MLRRQRALLARAPNAPRFKPLRQRRMASKPSSFIAPTVQPAGGLRKHKESQSPAAPDSTCDAELRRRPDIYTSAIDLTPRFSPGASPSSSGPLSNRGTNGTRNFSPSGGSSLNALTSRPEIQELLRKAAERRSMSTKECRENYNFKEAPTGSHSESQILSHAVSQGRIQFNQSPQLRTPQVVAVGDAKMPAPCLMQLSNNKDFPQSHCCPTYTQNNHCSGSVNESSDREYASSISHSKNIDGDDSLTDKPLENTLSSSEDSQIMSESGCVSDREQRDEPGQDSTAESEKENENPEEIHEPMSFQIPSDVLRTAMLATPNSPGSYYNQSLYRGPEGEQLSIHYCHTKEIAERVLPYFLEETVLGFDIEWKPRGRADSIKENASLIQIASEDRIALFHISLYPGNTPDELLPADLRTIIESPDICKVGVAIKGDFSRLEKYLGVKPKGVFELSRLRNLVEYHNTDSKQAASWKLYALAKQVHEHLQLPMYKGEVRESDWSKRLQMEQMAYAATDAYASLRVYDALEAKRKLLRPIPPRPKLCDYDSASRSRSTRAKPVRKAAVVPEKEEEDEASAYETAAEDLVDSHELEDSSDSELSTTPAVDSDAEYVPPSVDRVQVEDELTSTPLIPRKLRRVGRVKLGALTGPDPEYPILPTTSYDESDSKLAASSTLPHVSGEHGATNKALLHSVELSSRGEKVDLEDHLASLDLDVEPKQEDKTLIDSPRKDEERASSSLDPGAGRKKDTNAALINAESTSAPSLISSSALQVLPAEEATTPKISRKRKGKPTDASAAPSPDSETLDPQTEPNSTIEPTFKPLPADTTPKSPEYVAAEKWAQSYLYNSIPSASAPASSTPSRIRATLAHLRAYHMWHHQHMSVTAIAGHLRDPPLAESTVCSYILQAVVLERLDYRKEDIRKVLKVLPVGLRMTRWKWLVEKVGGVDGL